MPHLLAADLAATGSPDLRWMACNACWYLLARGDTRTAHDLASACASTGATGSAMTTSTRWAIAHYLAWALRDMGRYAEARDLDEDTLARRRRVLGEDHPDTLTSANNLAIDLRNLGEYQAARELDEDTLARHRRVLGDDHPDTLTLGEQPRHRPERPRRVSGGPRAGRGHPGPPPPRARRGPPRHPDLGEQPRHRPERPGRASGGPRAGRGHPGPPPPGARRGPPRHPDLGEQPRHRPERTSASIRRPASWTRTPWPAAAGCSARTTPTP